MWLRRITMDLSGAPVIMMSNGGDAKFNSLFGHRNAIDSTGENLNSIASWF